MSESRLNIYSIFKISDLRDTIASDLRTCDIISLADSTSELRKIIYSIRGQNTFFKTVANDLLRYVICAEWMKIQKLVNIYPDLMFKRSLVTILGKKMEFSPLEYAAYVRDWYSLKIFKTALKPEVRNQFIKVIKPYACEVNVPNKNETLSDPGYVEFIKLVDGWLAKDNSRPVTLNDLHNYIVAQTLLLSEQQRGYSLRPFYWVCEALLYVINKGSKIDDMDKDEFFHKVDGFAKSLILPRHMLKQMQAYHYPDGRYRWWAESNFDDGHFPTACLIIDYRRHADNLKYINTDSTDDLNDLFGIHYSITRGHDVEGLYFGSRTERAIIPIGSPVYLALLGRSNHDVEIFRRLEAVRQNQMLQLYREVYTEECKCESDFTSNFTFEITLAPADLITFTLTQQKFNDNPPGKGFVM